MITAALLLCLAPLATDGDTIKCGNSPARIRVFGVDSPDHTPEDAAARTALNAKVAGGLVCEPLGGSFNRTVARCYDANGADIGKAMIDEQLAKEWCAYSLNYYGTCAVVRPPATTNLP